MSFSLKKACYWREQTQPARIAMKLLDQVRNHLRLLHYSYRTEQSYVGWIERFIHFHKRRGAAAAGMAAADRFRHPRELGAAEVQEFLTYLAVARHVSASTQNQAFNALLFLYQKVLEIDLGAIHALRAKRPERLPVVLSRPEVARLLEAMAAAERARVPGTVTVGPPCRLSWVHRLKRCCDSSRRVVCFPLVLVKGKERKGG